MPPFKTRTDSPEETQKYPKIHVSTGEESSGFRTDSTQGLRPRHRREGNPERPPNNSHGDWPFLRPPERVPAVPVVSREHLPQLEKIQEVLCSSRDEAHFLCGVSRVITPNLWNFQSVLNTLAKTQEVPQHARLHSRGSTRVRPPPEELRFRLQPRDEGSFPASSGKNSRRFRRISRGGALHRKGERNSCVVPPFQESPRCLSPFQRILFSLHCFDFHAEDRLTPRWHV